MYGNPNDQFHQFDALSEFGLNMALQCFGLCFQGIYGDVTLEAPSYFDLKVRF